MGLTVLVFAGGLALPSDRWNVIVVRWLGMLAVWVPVAVCWVAVWRVGIGRREVPLAATAVTSYAVGNTYLIMMTSADGSIPFPSPADVGYLGFYPLMLAALTLAAHRRMRRLGPSVWPDSVVGALGAASVLAGAASVLAVLLRPALASALTGPVSDATVVAIGYPVFDVLLVAAVAGIVALRDLLVGTWWGVLIAGLLVFAATDVVYALRQIAGTYEFGSPLGAGWLIGLALVALWVDGATEHEGSPRPGAGSSTNTTTLLAPVVAATAGLAVLVVSSQVPLPTLAVALAAVAALAAMARTQMMYRELAQVADLRQVAATTDELTGLPNRRALYAQAHLRLADPQRRPLALMMLDVNKFKDVNDSLGHHAGDLLLIQVGARLLEHLLETDVLARLGGDEFAVLLQDAGPDQATTAASKLCAALAEPFTLAHITLHTSVSIGIALAPDDSCDLSTLLRKADIAMYTAKASGAGYHRYGRADYSTNAARLRTMEELRATLDRDEFIAY